MLHPDEGTIHAWLDGQLSPDERAKLEQHLDQCEQCAVLVVEARGLVAGATRIVSALDGVRGSVIPSNKSATATSSKSLWRTLRFTPARAAIAATLLLATATIFTIRQDKLKMHDMAAPAVATPASSPAPMAAPAPAIAAAAPPTAVPRPAGPAREARRTDRAVVLDSTSATQDESRTKAVAQAPPAAPRDSVAPGATAASGIAASKAALPTQPSPRRAFNGAIQLSEVVTTSMTQTTDPRAVGCYRLDVDSSRARLTNLRQFGLSAVNGVNVVRALGSPGRPDSVIPGAMWRALDRDSVAVSAPDGVRPASLVFALADEGRAAKGHLTTGDVNMPVQVLRTRCP